MEFINELDRNSLLRLLSKCLEKYPDIKDLAQQAVQSSSKSKTEDVSTLATKKNKKEFDMSRYHQRHIALQIQYDGGPYYGFASQVDEETVETHIFDALLKTRLIQDRESCCYTRCGRTDKGVSALGQVVSLKLRSNIPPGTATSAVPQHPCDALTVPAIQDKKGKDSKETQDTAPQDRHILEMDYCELLNKFLPSQIRVIGWSEVTEDFNARFSASSRKYRYFFLRKNLNIEAMRDAAKLLLGEHDFRNFCKMNIGEVSNFRREVHVADIVLFAANDADPDRTMCMLEIEGVAFLWHMVRCVMAVLFLVGEGREDAGVISQLLDIEAHPRKPLYNMASELPLVLHECKFESLRMKWTPKNLWNLTEHFERLYESSSVAAAQALNSLQFLKSRFVRRKDIAPFATAATTRKPGARVGLLDEETPPPKKRQRKGSFSEEDSTSTILWETCLKELSANYSMRYPYPTTALQGNAGGAKVSLKARYTPLMLRPTGNTYEERVSSVGGRKKDKLDRHTRMKEINIVEGKEFFAHLQKQGSLE
eukprot:GSChrysophyteH1.ASY1.ANO1.1778.1 assembled CDS